MFSPSVPVSDLVEYGTSSSPVLPIMDADGFQPRLVSYVPADSMGGSSAAGQQQIDQSINQQTQQQEQQYNDFTKPGNGSIVSDSESVVSGKLGLFDAVFELGESFWIFGRFCRGLLGSFCLLIVCLWVMVRPISCGVSTLSISVSLRGGVWIS